MPRQRQQWEDVLEKGADSASHTFSRYADALREERRRDGVAIECEMCQTTADQPGRPGVAQPDRAAPASLCVGWLVASGGWEISKEPEADGRKTDVCQQQQQPQQQEQRTNSLPAESGDCARISKRCKLRSGPRIIRKSKSGDDAAQLLSSVRKVEPRVSHRPELACPVPAAENARRPAAATR